MSNVETLKGSALGPWSILMDTDTIVVLWHVPPAEADPYRRYTAQQVEQLFDYVIEQGRTFADKKLNPRSWINIIYTDGISIEFLFNKELLEEGESISPASFKNWVTQGDHVVTEWVVDPGVTDVFVATDGITTETNHIRKCFSKEYYSLCGFKAATRKRELYKRMAAQDVIKIIDNIPSIKTANFETLIDGVRYRLENYLIIINFYDKDARFQILALKSYKGRQRGLNELAGRLSFGSIKYGGMPRPNHRQFAEPQNPTKWRAISPQDQAQQDRSQKYIIAFRSGTFFANEGQNN
ncbi:hypothetical protein BGW37DRAFT_541613 [Umbelopsis sp. PMI_123]|nr:hypothetical protein BGW37DRAFT_541613 [Umbelopsis sp. PMI_123]